MPQREPGPDTPENPYISFDTPASLAAHLAVGESDVDWEAVGLRAADMDKAGQEGAGLLAVVALQQKLGVQLHSAADSDRLAIERASSRLEQSVGAAATAAAGIRGAGEDARTAVDEAGRKLSDRIEEGLQAFQPRVARLEEVVDGFRPLVSRLEEVLSPEAVRVLSDAGLLLGSALTYTNVDVLRQAGSELSSALTLTNVDVLRQAGPVLSDALSHANMSELRQAASMIDAAADALRQARGGY